MTGKCFLYVGSIIVGLISGLLAAVLAFTITSKTGIKPDIGAIPIIIITLVGMGWFSYKRHFDWSIFFMVSLVGIVIFEIWFV